MPLRALRSHPSPLYRLPGTALVLIACGLAVLLTCALLAAFAWRDRGAALERAEAVATTAGLLVAEHAARLVETSDLILRQATEVAGPPDAPLPGDAATRDRLIDLGRTTPYITSIWLGDAAGNAVLTTLEHPAPRLNAAGRDYYRAHLGAGSALFIGRLDASRADGTPSMVLSRALRNRDGALRGFATVTVSARYVRELYRSIDIGFPATVSLVRGDGTLLVREDTRDSAGHRGAEGAAPITAQRSIGRFDLRAVVSIDREDALMPWRDRIDTYISYGVVALLTVAGMGALAMERTRRERAAEDALQHAHDTLEERVRTRTAELQDANARLEGLVADKEILLKEVQHRVKNNLTVICSLLRLQAGRLDERTRFAFDESLRRIQSMSLVHELLYRSAEPARINFADCLRHLSDGLLRTAGSPVRVAVEARDWFVDVDRAMPLALIASELISNALRHAFPDGRAGTVRVLLQGGEDGGEDREDGVRMIIADDGIGLPPDLPAANGRRLGGLGLMLVQALANQAHAALSIERGQGTAFTLTLTAATARRPKAA